MDMRGHEIKAALIKAGVTQAELARRTGYSPEHINRVLASNLVVGSKFQLEVSRVLDIPLPQNKAMRFNMTYALQRDVRDYLNTALIDERSTWYPIPNELKGAHGRFLAIGVKLGMPDLCVLFRGKAYFIELKDAIGLLSPDQRDRHIIIKATGCPVDVCRSVEEVRRSLRMWGIPLREDQETERLLRESER